MEALYLLVAWKGIWMKSVKETTRLAPREGCEVAGCMERLDVALSDKYF